MLLDHCINPYAERHSAVLLTPLQKKKKGIKLEEGHGERVREMTKAVSLEKKHMGEEGKGNAWDFLG